VPHWRLAGPKGKEVSLVFFSTFEPVELTPDSFMQRQGVPMLFDSASCSALPSLYICPVKNILGRVPMIPCFVGGNLPGPRARFLFLAKGFCKIKRNLLAGRKYVSFENLGY
jgi:hypothetical protein